MIPEPKHTASEAIDHDDVENEPNPGDPGVQRPKLDDSSLFRENEKGEKAPPAQTSPTE